MKGKPSSPPKRKKKENGIDRLYCSFRCAEHIRELFSKNIKLRSSQPEEEREVEGEEKKRRKEGEWVTLTKL